MSFLINKKFTEENFKVSCIINIIFTGEVQRDSKNWTDISNEDQIKMDRDNRIMLDTDYYIFVEEESGAATTAR